MVEKYNLDCYFHQDNHKKHSAGLNQKLLKDLGIIWVINYINIKELK